MGHNWSALQAKVLDRHIRLPTVIRSPTVIVCTITYHTIPSQTRVRYGISAHPLLWDQFSTKVYCIAGKFGGKLNLAVWQSTFATAGLLAYMYICVWWSLTKLPDYNLPIYLQWQFWAQLPNLIPANILAIRYMWSDLGKPSIGNLLETRVWFMVDKPYPRTNLHWSFRLIMHFAVELQSFVCDRAAPPIIKKLQSKGVAMHADGVSVYYAYTRCQFNGPGLSSSKWT